MQLVPVKARSLFTFEKYVAKQILDSDRKNTVFHPGSEKFTGEKFDQGDKDNGQIVIKYSAYKTWSNIEHSKCKNILAKFEHS